MNPPGGLADRIRQQIEPVLQRILPGRDGDLVDEPLHHERHAVGARRAQRARRDVERRDRRGVRREVRDEASRELVGGNDRGRAGDEVAERDQLARRVEPGLEVVEAARPILVVGHVVFSRPEQLHGHARQPGLRPLLGHDSRDLPDLDVVVAVQTTAESAARPHQVHRHLVGRRYRRRAPDSARLGIWLHDQISSFPSVV